MTNRLTSPQLHNLLRRMRESLEQCRASLLAEAAEKLREAAVEELSQRYGSVDVAEGDQLRKIANNIETEISQHATIGMKSDESQNALVALAVELELGGLHSPASPFLAPAVFSSRESVIRTISSGIVDTMKRTIGQ